MWLSNGMKTLLVLLNNVKLLRVQIFTLNNEIFSTLFSEMNIYHRVPAARIFACFSF